MSSEKSFRAQWSESLTKHGFTQISNVFLTNYHNLGISTGESLFIIHCFKFKWGIKKPFPSFRTISKEMGKNRCAVQRYARNLETKGFIQRNSRQGMSNQIDLSPLIRQLETICSNLHKDVVQKSLGPYSNLHTKEDELRKTNNNIKNYGIESTKEIINRKYRNQL